MPSLSHIIRGILSDTSVCCLCFTTIGETETPYTIEDEVSLGIDIEQTEVLLYEMVLTVLGDKVLDSISALKVICQNCTGTIIHSYKFIQQCQKNIEKLGTAIDSIQKHNQIFAAGNYDYKSIFVALDTSNYNVELFYDKHRNCNNQTLLHKRFQRLYKDAQHIFIDIELESNCNADNNSSVEIGKNCGSLQSNILSDIIHDPDDLNNLKCKTCLKTYPTVSKIKQHYLRVHAPKDFKCSQCPRSFGSSFLLKNHTKASHSSAVCSQCGKTFTNLYSLRYHEDSHRSLGLVCQTCGKVYKAKQAFNNHIEKKLCEKMRKSNSESQFTCDYCGKKYAQKASLRSHIRIEHENGRALICDWCGKKFSSTSHLKDHIIKHTKQKNFECKHCGGKFVSKTSLLYHTRMHTGQKPYKCAYCDMSFISASRRLGHEKTYHTHTNLECDICHGKFKASSLARHRRKHFDVRSRHYCNPPLFGDNTAESVSTVVLSSNNINLSV